VISVKILGLKICGYIADIQRSDDKKAEPFADPALILRI